MSETLGGVVKEAWSKSVMLGLLAIARRQKRDLAVIHFSGPDQLQASVFPKGESSPLELIDAVEFFFGGGTVFDRWMERGRGLSIKTASIEPTSSSSATASPPFQHGPRPSGGKEKRNAGCAVTAS